MVSTCHGGVVMTDHTPLSALDPTASRKTLPLPALGMVLAVSWTMVFATWISVTSLRVVIGNRGQQPLPLPTNALGTVLVVAFPLLLRQLPARLQRQAMPFMVLAGLMALGAGLVGGSRVALLLLVNASVLYVMGWLTLRGRTPKLMLVALSTPVLYGLGVVASEVVAQQPGRRILGYSPFGASVAWMLVEALLVGVLPICVPVLVASLLSRRRQPVTAVQDVPEGGSGISPTPRPNLFAVASLVLGLTAGSLFAVIFGHVARSQIRRSKETGSGFAAAGLVLGYLGVFATVAITLMGSMIFGFILLKIVG